MNDEPLVDLFGTTLADALIVDRPLSAWQGAARSLVAKPAKLLLGHSLFVTEPFVEAFLANTAHGPASACVSLGNVHGEFGPNPFGARRDGDTLHYELSLRPVDGGAADAAPVAVPLSESGATRAQPGRMSKPIFAPQGNRFAWSIGHWVDLLVANLLALQSLIGRLEATTIEADATVHPTAVVENSIIRSGATIGPFAVVRNSIIEHDCDVQEHTSIIGSCISPGCVVQTGAIVHGSVVGDSTVLSFQTATRGSLLLGSSTISTPVVARSVIGRDVFLARGVQLTASKLSDESVSVRFGARSVDTGIRLLGCAVGRGARIGSGVTVPPGFEVPAEYFLTQLPLKPLAKNLKKRVPVVTMDGKYRQFALATRSST